MQTLYSMYSANKEMPVQEALKMLDNNLQNSAELFAYLVQFLTEIALFAEKDATQKSQKHLPSQRDLNVSRKISDNEILREILSSESFQEVAKKFKTQYLIDVDIVRKCYYSLVERPEYSHYISQQQRDRLAERKILEFIFNVVMLPDERFVNEVEEKFIHWQDDADMMIVLMNTILHKPSSFDFTAIVGDEKKEFATALLESVIEKKQVCLSLIKPKLKNWDAERIASLDMILMEMGVCEFLYFETIPPRVTINEYIDLGKEYSTEQSGPFVNGILDSIHRDLVAQNKIHKKNFKNSVL